MLHDRWSKLIIFLAGATFARTDPFVLFLVTYIKYLQYEEDLRPVFHCQLESPFFRRNRPGSEDPAAKYNPAYRPGLWSRQSLYHLFPPEYERQDHFRLDGTLRPGLADR